MGGEMLGNRKEAKSSRGTEKNNFNGKVHRRLLCIQGKGRGSLNRGEG